MAGTPPDIASPPRDELVIKVLAALRPRGRRPRRDPGPPALARRADAAVDADQGGREDVDLPFALVVDAELFRLDSVVRWLDSAEAVEAAAVEPGSTTPPPLDPAETGGPSMSALQLPQVCKATARRRRCSRSPRWTSRRAGALVAVMGPSGSGKSRSSRSPAASRSHQRRGGSTGSPGDEVPRRQGAAAPPTVGYVFQDFNLLAGLTAGGERLAAAGARRGEKKARVQASRCSTGSAGGSRGPLPARALRWGTATGGDSPRDGRSAALLLADEPSGALDSDNSEEVMRLVPTRVNAAWLAWSSPTTRSWRRGRTGWSSSGTVGRRSDSPAATPESFIADLPAPSPRL